MSDFAIRARAALKERGLSLRAAARAVNYDSGYLSRVLSGKRLPSPDLAKAIDTLVGADGALAALAFALTPDDRGRIACGVSLPSRVDSESVAAMAKVLAAQRRLEDAVGPAVMLPGSLAQLSTVSAFARDARGPYRAPLLAVVAEMHQHTGWMLAAVRRDRESLEMLALAEEMADEAGAPTIAAVAVSFRGYVARQQRRFGGVVRASQAARHSPGAHETQQVFDTFQAAQGYAGLGQADAARRLLDEAARRAATAADPPEVVYWYSPAFFSLNIGMVHASLGDHADAADHLQAGLDGLPPEQRGAQWTDEYREALAAARAA
ncbi:helix-turn-helix domain-containing protein [Nocardiopsis mangrovi]|uniref:Helix-turn-helix domain-containing protein n=1 Tax=Nocardiopsis mangrovi TaxID=1179818 RepID=A0ABV9DZI9_9ACTN